MQTTAKTQASPDNKSEESFFKEEKGGVRKADLNKNPTGGNWESGILWLLIGWVVTASHCQGWCWGRQKPSLSLLGSRVAQPGKTWRCPSFFLFPPMGSAIEEMWWPLDTMSMLFPFINFHRIWIVIKWSLEAGRGVLGPYSWGLLADPNKRRWILQIDSSLAATSLSYKRKEVFSPSPATTQPMRSHNTCNYQFTLVDFLFIRAPS